MRNLLKYIEKFKELKEIKWGGGKQDDGTIQFSFPLYPVFVHEFEEELYRLELSNATYGDTMDKNGWWDQKKMIQDIPRMNDAEVIAALTAIYRGERFCDGLINEFIKNGAIVLLLEQLKTHLE